MKLRAQNFVLGFAAVLCFLDAFLTPKGSDPGPTITAVMGIVLIRRAIIVTPQPRIVIVAGCILGALIVVSNHELVDISTPVWGVLMLVAAVCYAFWERIEKLWG
jgi:hypothetical protein